jgi:hypothetical protein
MDDDRFAQAVAWAKANGWRAPTRDQISEAAKPRDRLKSAGQVLGIIWFAVCVLGVVVVLRGDHRHHARPSVLPTPAEVAKIPDRLPEPAPPSVAGPTVAPVDTVSADPVTEVAPEPKASVALNEPQEAATEAEPEPLIVEPPRAVPIIKRVSPHRRHHVVSYQHEPAPEPPADIDDSLLARFFKMTARMGGLIP